MVIGVIMIFIKGVHLDIQFSGGSRISYNYKVNGNKVDKSEYITPETTITAKANSFTYFFGIYAPIITTILSTISTTISVIMLAK